MPPTGLPSNRERQRPVARTTTARAGGRRAALGGHRAALLALAAVATLGAWALILRGVVEVVGPASGASSAGASDAFRPFGAVDLRPAFELDGAGENVDSIAFWEAPNPADTLMFVTAKDNQVVEVWRYPFLEAELTPLTHPTFAADTQVNGIVIDQATDRLFIAVGTPASSVAVFSLPDLADLGTMTLGEGVDLGPEPNLALLTVEDTTRLLVSSEDTVHVLDASGGSPVGDFEPEAGLETMIGDERDQAVYIPDENGKTGVYAYSPDGEPFIRGETNVFGTDMFQSDAEGIELYRCLAADGSDGGRGLIVVSDQVPRLNEFEVFDRESWEHLGTVRLTGVSNTDGIASTQRPLPRYPRGIFAVIDDDEETALIGWDRVIGATGLNC